MLSSGKKMTADEFKALIGPPPLMRSENADEFWNWWSAFAGSDQPKDLSDWFEVNDLTLKRWEERRLRRSASSWADASWRSALRGLLGQHGYDGIAEALVNKYFGDDSWDRKEAQETVAELGITDEHIKAAAIQKCGAELLIFDRMEDNRARASRQLRKEIERREVRVPRTPDLNQQ
jgi:hypothetical protein